MVDQVGSPLGRRRHIAAVRALVDGGEPGAAIIGRRHLLSRDALAAALASNSKAKKEALQPVDEMAAVRERYGQERKSAA